MPITPSIDMQYSHAVHRVGKTHTALHRSSRMVAWRAASTTAEKANDEIRRNAARSGAGVVRAARGTTARLPSAWAPNAARAAAPADAVKLKARIGAGASH